MLCVGYLRSVLTFNMTFFIYSIYMTGILRKNVYMLRMERHYILSAPGFSKWKIVFPKASSQNFLDSKKFLTKTLFPIRETKHLIAWITIKRIAALIHSFKLRQSENTRRIVNSPNFLFLTLKTKKLCSN